MKSKEASSNSSAVASPVRSLQISAAAGSNSLIRSMPVTFAPRLWARIAASVPAPQPTTRRSLIGVVWKWRIRSATFSVFVSVKAAIRKLFGVQYLSNRLLLKTVSISLVVIGKRYLRVAPSVEVADLVDALDRAGRGTPFFRDVFAFHVRVCVFEKRGSRSASLLRTPVHVAEFIDVEITRAGTATPFVFFTVDELVLEPVPTCIRTR